MAETIQALFCDPPIVIARLGGSTTPLDCCVWEEPPNPRADGATVLVTDWSLNVLPDGSIEPHKPDSIRFRDGPLIRPVCPFIEIWARLGEPGSDPSTWRDAPLTPALLAAAGTDASALRFTVDARNAKAARRRRNPASGLWHLPVRGDPRRPAPAGPAAGGQPAGRCAAADPARPVHPDRLGAGPAQPVRSARRPHVPGRREINLEVIRIRFTPAAGLFYGPPAAARPTNESPVPAVREDLAFLNPIWPAGSGSRAPAIPRLNRATRSTKPHPGSGISLGVVDDTCEARIDVTLQLPGVPRSIADARMPTCSSGRPTSRPTGVRSCRSPTS